ncbi:MAG: two-component regulator propeller domain-containing protein [Salibacteraceae bacterium]
MRSIFWSTCLLLLISWCSLNAPALRAIAPTHFNRHYDIQNGLPSNTTYSVIQDAQGYIWVGTDAGVCRFDGQQFVTFTVQDGLTDNEVLQLHEDSRGRIWILTYNGIPCYYYEGKFYNPENTPSLQHAVPPRHFKAFCETADGSVYLGGSRGFLARIYPDGKVETTVEKKIGHLCGLWENNNEVMAGGTPLFVHNFTRNTGEKLPFAKERTGHSRWLQKNGRMLVGLQHRFYCLNRQNEVLHQLDLPEGEVIQTVSHGPFPDQVAIGTSHGLRYWTFGTNEVSAPVLQGLSLAATCSDHENGYWVATINQGLFYAPSPGMRHFTSEHLPHVPVSSLVSWQNQVWFGAAYGLMGHLRGDALHVVPNRLEPQPGQISQMLPHNGGLLLLANKILFWYGPDGKLKPLHANNFTINTILKTEDGQLWVANRMGIVKWKED